MPKLYPHLWHSATAQISGSATPQSPPSWCKCGKCHEEEDPEDRLCCQNHPRNHENGVLDRIVLDKHTIEVALMNNTDWLNLPCIFSPAKMCNTAIRKCIIIMVLGQSWTQKSQTNTIMYQVANRDQYPEPDGKYQGYRVAY